MKIIKNVLVVLLAIPFSVSLLGCGLNIKYLESISEKSNKYQSIRQFGTTAVTASDVDAMKASTDVGDVRVVYGNAKSIHANTYIKLCSDKNKKLADILKKYIIRVAQKNRTAIIKVVDKNTGKSIDGLTNTDHSIKVQNMKLTILVPKNVHSFSVSSDVGDIRLAGIQGTINARTDTGDINVTNPYLYGQSNLHTDVGDINCVFRKPQARGGRMTLTSDTGDINVTAHNTKLNSHIRNENTVGGSAQINIADSFLIKAKTSVGDISAK